MINLTSGHICCGAGGDIVGAKAIGVKPVWAFDKNASAIASVLSNHNDVRAFVADVRQISENIEHLERVDMLFCGIPCQPYTRIGRLLGENDERAISQYVARVILSIKPRFLLFENVREYKNSVGFKILNTELSTEGYQITWKVLNLADYGLPQKRVRLFGLGISDCNYAPQFPEPTHTKERSLFDQRKSWIKFNTIKDGAGMKPLSVIALRGVLRRFGKHSKKGNGFSVQIIDKNDIMMTVIGTMYRGSGSSSNAILIWDNGIIRNVSFLEARRAQDFKDSYIFCGTNKEKWQQVGNAWPPTLVTQLIRSLLKK